MSTDDADELKPKKEDAIIALLNYPTVKLAAEAVGICEKTLHRWLDEPEFSRAHRRARRIAFSQAISLTNKYAPMAVQTLAKVMNDPDATHAAKVAAAAAMLKFSRESIELDDLAGRLEDLEGRVNSKHVENTAGRHP